MIEVIDLKTGLVKKTAKAENVVCNSLWEEFNRYWFYNIHYGDGQGIPSELDTTLFNEMGRLRFSESTTDNSHFHKGYISVTKKAVINEQSAVGVNFRELGIGKDNSTIYTHAMLTDMDGNPVSLTKSDTEIFNIYATVFLHFNTEGYSNGTVEVLPDRLYQFIDSGFSTTQSIEVSCGKGACVGGSPSNTLKISYDTKNREFSSTTVRASVGELNNISGFRYVIMPGLFCFDVSGRNRILGESVGSGDGVTKRFKTKFGFASNYTVYVDGVASSGVTVLNAPKFFDDLGRYFYALDENSTVENMVLSGKILPTRLVVDGSSGWPKFGEGVFYNPYYQYGLKSYTRHIENCLKISSSDDLINWDVLFSKADDIDIDISEYGNRKFWRCEFVGNLPTYNTVGWTSLTAKDFDGYDIVFETAPPSGSTITIDYDTEVVPKDENHVFDFSMTVKFAPGSQS